MRLPIWLLIVALPASAEFLVRDQPYRCHPADTACKSKFNLPYYERPAGENYSLNFVEYNDRGQPWSPHQLIEALAQIDRARADNPATLVLIYIHGWQNNAHDTGDVSHFQNQMLEVVGRAYFPASRPDKAPPVVGIYLAWRGLTFTAEPFKHVISYWPRRQVATNVGATGMFQAVEQIRVKVAEERRKTLFVLIGHSFGARVLENAVEGLDRNRQPGFMKSYRAVGVSAAGSNDISRDTDLPPADLIFYINAATSSAVTRRTLHELRDLCAKNPGDAICKSDPMYYAVTSHADLATGLVLPIANLVIPALFTDGLHLISAANSPWLHTHHDPVPMPDCPPPPQSLQCAAGDAFCFRSREEGKRVCYEVDPIRKDQSARFWIMNVGSKLINGHGDVWNQDVIRLIQAVLGHNRRFREMTK